MTGLCAVFRAETRLKRLIEVIGIEVGFDLSGNDIWMLFPQMYVTIVNILQSQYFMRRRKLI